MPSYYFERALFIMGEPNSSKSNQLRSMFRDVRLGTGGNLPTGRRLDEVYRLSNERTLYLRLTSPHEAGESLGVARLWQHGKLRLTQSDFVSYPERVLCTNTQNLQIFLLFLTQLFAAMGQNA